MNFKAATTRILGAATVLMFAGSVYAQEIAVDTTSGQPNTQVTNSIDWTGDGTVDNITVWIEFDPAVITPEVTGTNNDVVGCLDGLPASHTGILTTCRNPAATPQRIVLVISDQAGAGSLPTTNVGTINFDIASGATTGTTETITVTTQEATDSGLNDVTASVTDTNGAVDIVSGPQSTLSVTPASVAFGQVDINNLPQTATITAENTGDANSSLTFQAGTGYTGDTAFTVQSDACSGATLNQNETCDVVIEFDSAAAGGPFSGTFSFASDANTSPNVDVAISGEATSQPVLSVNPAFGPVNLGTVFIGTSTSVGGSVTNSGSADGTFSCTYNGDPQISVTPDLSGGITVPANGGSASFSVGCAVPDTAADGDVYTGTLECTGDLAGTHSFECTATAVPPIPVPTNSKWGLAILSLLVLMIGGLTVRFFRT